MGGKGSYVEESSTRREVEEPLVTGHKATGKAEGEGAVTGNRKQVGRW